MRSRRLGATALTACAVLLSGCSGRSATNSLQVSIDPFGCGIVVTPELALIGEHVTVSRPATDRSEACTTLAPGTTQTLELRSIVADDSARRSATVVVEPDGSFEVTMPIPSGIRLQRAHRTAWRS